MEWPGRILKNLHAFLFLIYFIFSLPYIRRHEQSDTVFLSCFKISFYLLLFVILEWFIPQFTGMTLFLLILFMIWEPNLFSWGCCTAHVCVPYRAVIFTNERQCARMAPGDRKACWKWGPSTFYPRQPSGIFSPTGVICFSRSLRFLFSPSIVFTFLFICFFFLHYWQSYFVSCVAFINSIESGIFFNQSNPLGDQWSALARSSSASTDSGGTLVEII